MLSIRQARGGIFLSFPFDDLMHEFVQATEDWHRRAKVAPEYATGPYSPVGLDTDAMITYLFRCVDAVGAAKEMEAANKISGMPEEWGMDIGRILEAEADAGPDDDDAMRK